jgi:hypothetical protein
VLASVDMGVMLKQQMKGMCSEWFWGEACEVSKYDWESTPRNKVNHAGFKICKSACYLCRVQSKSILSWFKD